MAPVGGDSYRLFLCFWSGTLPCCLSDLLVEDAPSTSTLSDNCMLCAPTMIEYSGDVLLVLLLPLTAGHVSAIFCC